VQIETQAKLMKVLGEAVKAEINPMVAIMENMQAAGISINLNEWFAVDETTLGNIGKLAKEIRDLQDSMNAPGIKPEAYLEKSQELAKKLSERDILAEQNKATFALAGFGMAGVSARYSTLGAATGSQADRATYGMNAVAFDELTTSALALNKWFLNLPEDSKAGLMGYMQTATEAIKNAVDKLALEGPNKSVNAVNALGRVGVSTDVSSVNRMNDAQRAMFTETAKKIYDQSIIANDPDATEAVRQGAQAIVDAATSQLSENVKKASLKFEETAIYIAAKNFADTVTDGFVNGIKDVLSGKMTAKEGLDAFVKTFTDSVVNTFIEGMMSPLTGENGIIKNSLKMLGAGIFGWGETIAGGDPQTIFSNAVDKFALIIANSSGMGGMGAMSGTTANTSIWSTIGGWVSDAWSTFTGVTAATGGYISGPGTGRSDSIPAMLSNGEFVVNAAATSKFKPLLRAINAGAIGFADGGAVGVGGSATSSPVVTAASLTSTVQPVVDSLAANDAALSQTITDVSTWTDRSFMSMQQATQAGFAAVDANQMMLAHGVANQFAQRDLAQAKAAVESSKTDKLGMILSIVGMVAGAMGSFSKFATTMGSTASMISATGAATEGVSSISAIANPPKISFTKLATGGSVWGPGTGLSDSIPAMLSNGEFVVNAKQAQKFRGLLQTINSGNSPHMSDGGMVGYGFDAIEKAMPSRNNNTTVNNITITGDISRQTRLEVLKLMPQISAGTKQIAYEQGRR
jgi:hypothetical protein